MDASQRLITWTPARLQRLRDAIRAAEVAEADTFTIPAGVVDEHPVTFDRRYAEYLAQYLEEKLT